MSVSVQLPKSCLPRHPEKRAAYGIGSRGHALFSGRCAAPAGTRKFLLWVFARLATRLGGKTWSISAAIEKRF